MNSAKTTRLLQAIDVRVEETRDEPAALSVAADQRGERNRPGCFVDLAGGEHKDGLVDAGHVDLEGSR